MKHGLRAVMALIAVLLFSAASANDGLEHKKTVLDLSLFLESGNSFVLPHAEYWVSPPDTFSAEEVLREYKTLSFASASSGVSQGYTSESLWLKLSVEVNDFRTVILKVVPSFLDQVQLYHEAPDGTVKAQEGGDHVPVTLRALPSRHATFLVELDPGVHTLLLRLRSGSTLTAGLHLMTPERYQIENQREFVLYGALLGLIVMAILVSLIVAFRTREAFFLVTAGYLFSFGATEFTTKGFDQLFIYPSMPWLSDHALGVSAFSTLVLLLAFVGLYLRTRRHFPRIFFTGCFIAVVSFIGVVISLGGGYLLIAPALMLTAPFVIVGIFVTTLLSLRAEPARARLMLLTTGPSLIAIILRVARNAGWLPHSFWTSQLWPALAMLQVIFVVVLVFQKLREDNEVLVELRKDNDFLRKLYGMVAHEIRTPLAVASSAVHNIELRTLPSMPELEPRFRRAKSSLFRLGGLLDNVLGETILGFSEGGTKKDICQISALLDDIRHTLVISENHRLSLSSDCAPEFIHCDRRMLSLALINLLGNAFKYSPEGGEVGLRVRKYNQDVFFEVTDQGVGVAEADRPYIFNRGYRGDDPSRNGAPEGFGLGLYLVKLVAADHCGSLQYEARNPGSLFRLIIPLTD